MRRNTASAFSLCRVQEMRWAMRSDASSWISDPAAAWLFANLSKVFLASGLHPPPCASKTMGVNVMPTREHSASVFLKERFKCS